MILLLRVVAQAGLKMDQLQEPLGVLPRFSSAAVGSSPGLADGCDGGSRNELTRN